MFTPQQIEQISFSRATFGGYDMQAVDEFLEPLTEDYITLYKENALLKSKMKVLVSKLEEYRNNEASMKDAIVNAQKTCDMMVKEAEAKCTQMLSDANQAADEPVELSAIKGKVIAVIPALGNLTRILKTPTATILLLAAAVLMMERSFRKEKQKKADDLELIKEEIRKLKEEQEENLPLEEGDSPKG